jgi:hypothetical protein
MACMWPALTSSHGSIKHDLHRIHTTLSAYTMIIIRLRVSNYVRLECPVEMDGARAVLG